MIKEVLEKKIKEALRSLSVEVDNVHLEHPQDFSHGDYSTNVAMTLGKKTEKNPRELADKIVRSIEQNKPKEVEKIEVAGSGFINFYLSREFFIGSIQDILKNEEKWGSNVLLKDKKIIVEYTDPNPFKEFHIGHLMSNAIGEALSRIVEFSGAEVKRANYQGDVGMHVAKAVWGIQEDNKDKGDIALTDLENTSVKEVVKKLGQWYTKGSLAYDASDSAKKEIQKINKDIYSKEFEKINPEAKRWYDFGRKLSLYCFEAVYQKLGTKFDYYFFESETSIFGQQIVKEFSDVFEKSDDAIIFKGEKYGLHTRVFINSDGLPTYEAKELGLAQLKYDTYPYDISMIITGNEVTEYFKVVLKAMELVYPELAKKTKHIPHGMLRLTSGKMSSRTGEVITAESLFDEVEARVNEKMKDADSFEARNIVEAITVGAIKYSILKQAAGKDIIFDFATSLSFEGDSGPYLQYAHTRAQSVLMKAEKEGASTNITKQPSEITDIEKLLYQFPEVVERAGKEYEPHHIVTYLIALAGAFNSYYAKEKILDGSDEVPYKLALTKSFQVTMKNGLWLLGIKVPERM